jgi:hypothetical protein
MTSEIGEVMAVDIDVPPLMNESTMPIVQNITMSPMAFLPTDAQPIFSHLHAIDGTS